MQVSLHLFLFPSVVFSMAKRGRKPVFKNEEEREIAKKHRAVIRRDHNKNLDAEIKLVGKRNKEVRDADLRLRLEGKKTIDRINCIVDEFTLLDQQIKKARNTPKNPYRLKNRISKNTARGSLLKTQADLLFKKLNKLLPDIKAIEHSGTFKPSKPDNLPEEQLVDILKGNVDMEELVTMFPQYKDLMQTLEDLDIPELVN